MSFTASVILEIAKDRASLADSDDISNTNKIKRESYIFI